VSFSETQTKLTLILSFASLTMGRTSRSGKVYDEWSNDSYGRLAKAPGTNNKTQNKRTKDRRTTRALDSKRPRTDADDTASVVTAPTPATKRSHTRSQRIRCTVYGTNRANLFPCHYFCSQCADWEFWQKTNAFGQKLRDSRRNECTANHTNPAYPTTLKTGVLVEEIYNNTPDSDADLSSDEEEEEEEIEDVIPDAVRNEIETPVVVAENRQETTVETIVIEDNVRETIVIDDPHDKIVELTATIARLRELLVDSEFELDRVKTILRQIQSRVNSVSFSKKPGMSNLTYVRGLGNGFLSAFKRTTSRKKKKAMASELFTTLEDDLDMKEKMLTYGKMHFRKNVFNPFAVLRKMDLEGGKLNYEAIELLRELETNGEKNVRNTLVPTVGELKKAAKVVEEYGKHVAPFTCGVTEKGAEKVEFDPEHVIRILLEAADLLGLDRKVILSQAIDGSRFSKHIGFILYGLKLNDYAAKCPWTKKPLFTVDGEGKCSSQLQSKNTQIPLKVVIGKEDHTIYGEFVDVMQNVAAFKNFKIGEENERSVDVSLESVCTDMSAQWKGTGKGGACKVCKKFCSCCATDSKDVHKANPVLCARFCQELHSEEPGWCCYHKEFLTEEAIDKQETELENMLNMTINERLKVIDTWLPNCRLGNKEDPRILTSEGKIDPVSIHYDVRRASRQDRNSYSVLINNDLKVRSLSTRGGDLIARQKRLRLAMIEEKKFQIIQEEVEHGNKGRVRALFTTLNNPTCILHMHNRIALKFLSVIFKRGLSNAMTGLLDDKLFAPDAINRVKGSIKKRFDAFVSKVEGLFNTQVWGSVYAPTHWQIPVDENEKKLLPLCLDNERCKAALDSIDTVIDFLFTNNNQPEEYKQCISLFRQLFVKLRKKTPFSDPEILEFQRTTDEWFQMWMDLEGWEGCTNYTHMLGSGHIADLLFHHRNLYVFSNQGWEALNSLIKQVYFRRTGRGGGRQSSSRLLPIARWLQRRLVFMSVSSEEDMMEKLNVLRQEAIGPIGPEEQEQATQHDNDDIFEGLQWL
jgi:hypothetical protein